MKKLFKEVDFKNLKVSSTVFPEDGFIPARFTCDGDSISPPLNIEHIPEEAKSLSVIVDDPDAPAGTWVHWLIWNIPVAHLLKENHTHGQQGLNSYGKQLYSGPCPPAGIHRYFFKVYALDCLLQLPGTAPKEVLEKAMAGHILAFGELVGLYKRSKNE